MTYLHVNLSFRGALRDAQKSQHFIFFFFTKVLNIKLLLNESYHLIEGRLI